MQAAPRSMVHNGVVVTTLGPGIDNRALSRFARTPKTGGAPGEFNDPREAAMYWPRNKGMDGSVGRDDWFLKSGAQSVDLAGSDFIIIDSLNRGEFGTGIGRLMNIPIGGVESDKESSTAPDGGAAIIPGLPRYLPPNYYLDATRAVVRWAKPEDKQHYIENVECPVMTSTMQCCHVYKIEITTFNDDGSISEVRPERYTYEKTYPPASRTEYNYIGWIDEFLDWESYRLIDSPDGSNLRTNEHFREIVVRGKGFMPHPDTDTVEVFANDLMDDYDAAMDDNKHNGLGDENKLDNNLRADELLGRSLIDLRSKSDTEIHFRIRVPTDEFNRDQPGIYSIQIRNTNSTYNQHFSLFAPFVVNILPDMVN